MSIIEDMNVVRKYCKLGNKIRKEEHIPNNYRLQEVQFNGCQSKEHPKYHFLMKGFYELIRDELNTIYINPFFCFKEGEKWIIKKDGDFELALRIDKTKEEDERHAKLKEYRQNIMREKKEGTYNESTYKKYKCLNS